MSMTNSPQDRTPRMSPGQRSNSRYWKYVLFIMVVLAIAVPFVVPGGINGIRNSWWLLFLLICPLSMIFMMGHSGDHDRGKGGDISRKS